MPYKIAVASSDGVNIDMNFGSAHEFFIYEVGERGECALLEIREAVKEAGEPSACKDRCKGGGCEGSRENHPKVDFIADCRCVICKKIGFHIQKQLEKKAVSTFDVEGKIEDTLEKITWYFHRVDHHQTLRGMANVTLKGKEGK
jgi:nitrogen fixation protein NifX